MTGVHTGARFASGARFYKVMRSGYLIFDRGAHGGKRPEEEGPEPQPRAIHLYEYLGVIYRRTQSGEGATEKDIHIVLWDNRWLEEEVETPIQWENHRRHYFERSEQEEIINLRVSDLYRADEEEDNNDKGEDVKENEDNYEEEDG